MISLSMDIASDMVHSLLPMFMIGPLGVSVLTGRLWDSSGAPATAYAGALFCANLPDLAWQQVELDTDANFRRFCGGFWWLAIGSARRGKRSELAWLSSICLAGLLLVLWVLHRGSDDTDDVQYRIIEIEHRPKRARKTAAIIDAHLPVANAFAHDLQALAAIAGEPDPYDPVTEASGRRLDQRNHALFNWVRRAQKRPLK